MALSNVADDAVPVARWDQDVASKLSSPAVLKHSADAIDRCKTLACFLTKSTAKPVCPQATR